MSTSFGKVIEINPASPTYLRNVRHFYFWQLWKCLCLSMCAHVLDLFTCTFVCLWHPPKKCVHVVVCASVCVQTDKALRYCRNLTQAWCPCWVIKEYRASFSLTKEHIWLFAWLAVSLSLCLKGKESVAYKRNAVHWRTILTRWKSNTALEFRNHEVWVAALLIHTIREMREFAL